MNYVEVVTAATRELKLLTPAGKLLPLDSMAMIKLAVAIEDATGIVIPPASVVPKHFRTVEAIAKLLEELLTTAK